MIKFHSWIFIVLFLKLSFIILGLNLPLSFIYLFGKIFNLLAVTFNLSIEIICVFSILPLLFFHLSRMTLVHLLDLTNMIFIDLIDLFCFCVAMVCLEFTKLFSYWVKLMPKLSYIILRWLQLFLTSIEVTSLIVNKSLGFFQFSCEILLDLLITSLLKSKLNLVKWSESILLYDSKHGFISH